VRKRIQRSTATATALMVGAAILVGACSSGEDSASVTERTADSEQAATAQPADEQTAGAQDAPTDAEAGNPADDTAESSAAPMAEQDAEQNAAAPDLTSAPVPPAVLGALLSVSELKVTPGDPESNDEFAWSLAIGGNTLMSGSPLSDDNGGNSGTAYVFNWDGAAWIESTKLAADDGREGDWFGKSVAVSGDTAVVGANLDDGPLRDGFYDDDTGSAYVFQREQGPDGEVWRQTAKLRADLQIEWSEFGFDVEIDGDTIVVSAWHDPTAGFNTGAVYVFRRDGEGWAQEAQLLPGDSDDADEFGIDIAIDGDTILVGTPRDDENGPDAGAVYVFRRVGGVWSQEAILRTPDSSEGDDFGWSVALDGDRALIGAPFHDGDELDAGGAYIFERNGNTWSEAQRLLPRDPLNGAWFGRAVGIAGEFLVVGAPRFDRITADGIANELFNIGVSYVFHRGEEGWVQIAQLRADDAGEGDDFGWTVAMTEEIVIVGAWLDDTEAGVDTGSLYSFVVPTRAGGGS